MVSAADPVMTDSPDDTRRLQAEYAHASRLAILGQLAASIAHEVNQPLAAIAANGAAATRWLARPEPDLDEVRAIAANIVSDARRAADSIARIRDMASNARVRTVQLDLNALIREALVFLGHDLGLHGVTVTPALQAGLPMIDGDRVQLQQVIVNLILNAAQEMTKARIAQPRIILRSLISEGMVVVEVEDTGPGIAREHLPRLFDSFFTTKAAGLGMGLSICRSIVQSHGGHIAAENHAAGARFRFSLPSAIELKKTAPARG